MAEHAHPEDQTEFRLPRVLLLWWSLWLLASWAQAFMWRWSSVSNPASYTAALQYMLLAIGLGLAVVWPLFRLSLPRTSSPRRMAFVDWVALMGTLQVVIWPTRMTTQWSLPRMLLADVLIGGWGLILAGLLAWCLLDDSRWQRVLWMVVMVLISVLAPAIWLVGSARAGGQGSDELLFWSPVSMMWLMGKNAHILTASYLEWVRAAIVWGVAGLIWSAAAIRPLGAPDEVGA